MLVDHRQPQGSVDELAVDTSPDVRRLPDADQLVGGS
jgi:hypothetical protein